MRNSTRSILVREQISSSPAKTRLNGQAGSSALCLPGRDGGGVIQSSRSFAIRYYIYSSDSAARSLLDVHDAPHDPRDAGQTCSGPNSRGQTAIVPRKDECDIRQTKRPIAIEMEAATPATSRDLCCWALELPAPGCAFDGVIGSGVVIENRPDPSSESTGPDREGGDLRSPTSSKSVRHPYPDDPRPRKGGMIPRQRSAGHKSDVFFNTPSEPDNVTSGWFHVIGRWIIGLIVLTIIAFVGAIIFWRPRRK